MPKIIEVEELGENKFAFETSISLFDLKKSKALIQIPFRQVRKKNLFGKKLRVTIEPLD